jgi:hypothetical protein
LSGPCCGSWAAAELVHLDRRELAKRGVSTLAIMEDIEVFEHRVGELQSALANVVRNICCLSRRQQLRKDIAGARHPDQLYRPPGSLGY